MLGVTLKPGFFIFIFYLLVKPNFFVGNSTWQILILDYLDQKKTVSFSDYSGIRENNLLKNYT